MTKKQIAEQARILLKERYPDAVCSLDHGGDPYKLIVMARLSAQCTDERVNRESKALFERFPTVESLAAATREQVEPLIFSCGLYHTKARDIIGMAKMLVEEFDGKVPEDMESLLKLPGVGRKIANLMRGDVFGKGGIVADTHCIRIAGKLGLTASKNPAVVERDLDKLIPLPEQSDFCHRLVLFGRDVCQARTPGCAGCPLRDICKSGRVRQ